MSRIEIDCGRSPRVRGLALNTLGLIDRVVAHTPTVTRAWVDAGLKDDVAIHGAVNGIDVEQVNAVKPSRVRADRQRWIVEQVHGTLMLHRRLVREYETRPASSESRTWWAATANLVRRLTDTTTASWRHPASGE